MSLLPVNTDYTDLDFDATNDRLERLIRSVFPGWTDFNYANFGNILKELNAHILDSLGFYLDGHAGESRWTTAVQRKNVIAHLKLISYAMSTAGAATVDEEFTLREVPVKDVVISAGTIVKTKSVTTPIRMQLMSAVTISAGADPPTVAGTVEHSETRSQIFTLTGLADQELQLDGIPYLDDSLAFIASNGTYQQVDSFLNSTATDKHFVVLVDQRERALVRFGDNRNGLPPTGTGLAIYKTGGGASGNVEEDTLTAIEGSFTDEDGVSVYVTVNNPLAASGGEPRESVVQARILAPESVKAITRTVTRTDFESNARQVSGVSRALMLTSDELVSIGENAGQLYIVPTGGGAPSTALKESVAAYLREERPYMLTFTLSVIGAVYKVINVTATVYLSSGAVAATVKAAIEAALASHFAPENADGTPNTKVDFGYNIKDVDGSPAREIAWSAVHDVVKDTTGVRKVKSPPTGFLLNGLASDVQLELNEFPQRGSVQLVNGDTGMPL